MKKILRVGLLVILLSVDHLLIGQNIITFFIRPYHTQDELKKEAFFAALQAPGQLAREMLRNLIEVGTYQGVLASYMGYLATSTYTGQITFPRRHPQPEVKLLVTPMVEPVMMIGNTVHHLSILSSLPAKLYRIERKQDPETKIFYWDTEDVELPENRRITLDTIIIFAKPDTIIVPTGITPTVDSITLMLPDMYATEELSRVIDALRMLNIRHFFGPIRFNYKELTPTDFAKQLVPQ